ncbi:GNAT family N-acetyltransferase [Sphingobium sp. CAP-1]|uniref:GNAT family N-acetyltransferase n=1 Tax=Sphingobium sp. CAP-1 TaxID=2676077 RepID=UPI001E445A79|nr:GNAT family N-acetyltransferase [Sphingobium sp. CAP-1]
MKPADLPAVKAISDAVHGAYTEAEAVYAERLALYPDGCRIFDQDGAVLGYLIAHPWRSDAPPALDTLLGAIPATADIHYLHDLALLPAARGSGAGASGSAAAIAQAQAAGYKRVMLMAVGGADSFWERQGFARVPGQIASYGTEACLMERWL